MAVRPATEEEKRKIADSIEVEIENSPESKDPVDIVLSQIQSYHDNMVQQISNVEQMIYVNDKKRPYRHCMMPVRMNRRKISIKMSLELARMFYSTFKRVLSL